ncbi:BTAD domain-containing putative transcriptional regulator [Streptomyces sp. NPDC005791]|uniref:AfsR/SARP family transcriptional regulator n=1 Tax=unclassified Streptomyces TaxID=2593676 RepID=UPI0033C001B1
MQLLGPVRAWRSGREIILGPPKQRAVFALLAGRANDVVSVDHIIDAVWGGDIPQTAANGVHTYVAGLRRVLEPERSRRESGELLISTAGGYALQTDPGTVDATVFARCHAQARRARAEGRLQEALDTAESALSLWRGEAHSGVPGPFAAMERTRLQDLRLTAVEEWAADMLEADRPVEAVTVLLGAVAEEPLREKLRWLLMTALYRCGRQAHALEVYAETRRMLRHELGIDPSTELRTLHQQILTGSPLTPTGSAGAPAVTGAGAPVSAPEPPATRLMLAETPRPAQLPPLARGFVGRSRELEHLARLLTQNDPPGPSTPVVVVDGPAGVGKSAFTLELAHRLSERFPDGQLYIDLYGTSMEGRSLSASEALLQVLRSLGVADARIPADPAGRATLYRSLLHGKRVLVMLDDVLSADQLRPLIPGSSSCVISTGRQRLGGLAVRDGAHLLRLDPLGTQDALALLRCLSGDRLRHQEAVARRLVGLSAGLPLALRIMAETLAANPDVPLAALVEHVAEEHGRLDRLAAGGDSTSLHALFETCYQALPAEAARMFRLLGLLSNGPVTLSAAADLTGTPEPEAAVTLETLTRRHLLVETGNGLYRFNELVRLYAAECAEREPLTHRSAAVARLQATPSVA